MVNKASAVVVNFFADSLNVPATSQRFALETSEFTLSSNSDDFNFFLAIIFRTTPSSLYILEDSAQFVVKKMIT